MSRCRHCDRGIVHTADGWADPEATDDDEVWRLTCDSHDTFTAEHEPVDDEVIDRWLTLRGYESISDWADHVGHDLTFTVERLRALLLADLLGEVE